MRAGNPPSVTEMLSRFHRNQGLEKLGDYWKSWEIWFADLEETHTTLPFLVFFRSPRAEHSWITSAGVVFNEPRSLSSAVNIPYETSAALSIRAGYLTLRRIANCFELPIRNNQLIHRPPITIRKQDLIRCLTNWLRQVFHSNRIAKKPGRIMPDGGSIMTDH